MKSFSIRITLPVLLLGTVLTAFALQKHSPNRHSSQHTSPIDVEPASNQIATKLFIRVNLTPQPVKKIGCRIGQPFKIVALEGKRILAMYSKSVKTEIVPTKNGVRIAGKVFTGSQFEIVPQKSPSIEIAGTLYRGRMRLYRRGNSRFIVVNILPLEDYLASVLNGEMPAAFPVEARKAQLIAARTYALYQMLNPPAASRYDLFASSLSQKYLGFRYKSQNGKLLAGETKTSRNLVHETAGMICILNGQIFCSYYSAVCGGKTVAGIHVFESGAPLRSVKCPWCQPAKKYRWKTSISFLELRQAMAKGFPKIQKRFPRITSVSMLAHSQNPDKQTIAIQNGRFLKRISPMQFRKMFPAKIFSMRFSISNGQGGIRVAGMGHGHGVGMCQWGARGMALAGATYEKILKHYYPGAKIVSLESIIK